MKLQRIYAISGPLQWHYVICEIEPLDELIPPAQVARRPFFKEINVNKSTVDDTSEETGTFELMDCGQASEVTRGIPLVILYELGIPPWNKLFLF